MNQINRVGNILPTRTRDNPNQGRVYDVTGIAPAICCGGGMPLVITRFEDENSKESGSGGYIPKQVRTFNTGYYRESAEPLRQRNTMPVL